MAANSKKRVAIIGAGASGIAATRQALDYGVEPIVFEMALTVGGLWRYKPEETEESSVMKSTVINTSKEMTAFSDFPPPAEAANFMHNRKMLDYLQDYAKHFDLTKFIRFSTKVLNIIQSPNYKQNGTWTVTFENGKETLFEEFDGVLICTGHHAQPYMPPKWSGQDKFCGVISHAHSYKDHRGFEDKVVAVVGVGNSGVDVAVELSRIGKQVYLVTRRGTWVFNRNFDHSQPFDLVLNRRCVNYLFAIFPVKLCHSFVTYFVEKRLDHEKYGLKPKHNIFAAHWTVNDELSNRLSSGTLIVKPNIQSLTDTGIIFEDGSTVDNVDQIICCTGYSFGFPILGDGKMITVEDNKVDLYKYMFPLKTTDHNTLGVIGFIQPLGSIMPISEMQARVYFEVFTGRTTLPTLSKMQMNIQSKREEMENRYVQSRRHTIQVDYVTYMDELASIIGCKPSLFKTLLTDPCLASRLVFGPNYPYVYRIFGPKPWDGARQAIMDADRRKICGMRGLKEINKKPKNYCKVLNIIYLISIIFAGVLIYWLLF